MSLDNHDGGGQATKPGNERRRVFVRELAGKYSKIFEEMIDGPRRFSSADVAYRGGPQHFNKTVVSPEKDGTSSIFHSHLDVYVPGARSQRHAHMNSAVFYILEGQGYDIHDGKRLDWKAGDVVIVEPGCVHQHFNASETDYARMLVIKAKPVYMFANLMYQRMLVPNAKDPVPGYEDVDPTKVDPYAIRQGRVD